MALLGVFPPNYIVDNESDRSTSWPEGTMVYCKDTNKLYVLEGTSWILIGPASGTVNIVKKGADQRHESTSWATITNLAQSVAANEDWAFEIFLWVTLEQTTAACVCGMTGPASPANFALETLNPQGLSNQVFTHGISGYDSGGNQPGSGPANTYLIKLDGILENGASAGTLQPRIEGETATGYIDILAESWARYTKLN